MLVGVVLHEHQATEGRMLRVAEVIRQAGLESQIPITFSMSGMTIDKLAERQPDVCGGIRWDFANRHTGWDPGRPELVISTQHNNPLILPEMPRHLWGTYFDHFLTPQVAWSKAGSEAHLHRTPQGFFPSEMIFTPAGVNALHNQGLEYCLIPGEFFGDDKHAKTHLYHVNMLRPQLIPRVNEFRVGQPEWADAYALKDAIKGYGYAGDAHQVVVGCDLGEFTGLYHEEGRGGISLEDGIARLRALKEAIDSDPDMHMVNCGAIALYSHSSLDIDYAYSCRGVEDPHHFITTWMNGAGDLSGIHMEEVWNRIRFVQRFHENIQYGEVPGWLQEERNHFFVNGGMENMMDW